MNVYHLYVRSRPLYIAGFVIYAVVLFLIAGLLLNTIENEDVFGLLFLSSLPVIGILATLIAKLTARGIVQITMDEQSMLIAWQQRFLFTNKPDINLRFEDIIYVKHYSGKPTKRAVKIVTNDGRQFKFRQGYPFNATEERFDGFLQIINEKVPSGAGITADERPTGDLREEQQLEQALVLVRKVNAIQAIIFIFLFFVCIFSMAIPIGLYDAGVAVMIISIIIMLGGILLLMNVWEKFSNRRAELKMGDTGFSLKYLQAWPPRNLPDEQYVYSAIKSYKVDSYQGTTFLILGFTDGRKLQLSEGTNTDIQEVAKAILERSERGIGKEAGNDPTRIIRKKPFMETIGALLSGYLLLAILLGGLLMFVLHPREYSAGDGVKIAFYCIGIAFYLLNLYLTRRAMRERRDTDKRAGKDYL